MVCNSLPTKEDNLPDAEGNQEIEFRFHRILREKEDSEPVGLQQIAWQRLRKRQRATQAAWSPIGKRTKVSQIQSSICNMFLLNVLDSVLSQFL